MAQRVWFVVCFVFHECGLGLGRSSQQNSATRDDACRLASDIQHQAIGADIASDGDQRKRSVFPDRLLCALLQTHVVNHA